MIHLSKAMNEHNLKQIEALIAAKRIAFTPEKEEALPARKGLLPVLRIFSVSCASREGCRLTRQVGVFLSGSMRYASMPCAGMKNAASYCRHGIAMACCRVMHTLTDEELLSESSGMLPDAKDDITCLRHVRPYHAPEFIAERQPCRDFDVFAPLFAAVCQDLQNGVAGCQTVQEGFRHSCAY